MNPLGSFYSGIFQFAYVCQDVKLAAADFKSRFGTGDFDFKLGLTVDDVIAGGTPASGWTIDVAVVNMADTNIELIKPVAGAVDLYRDVIRPGHLATFHHVGVEVADLDQVREDVAAAGLEFALYGRMPGFCRFAYLDMREELGHFVEYVELDELGKAHFAALRAQATGSVARAAGS
jgi:hypothetical protein